jgi:hypothetical protein
VHAFVHPGPSALESNEPSAASRTPPVSVPTVASPAPPSEEGATSDGASRLSLLVSDAVPSLARESVPAPLSAALSPSSYDK